ncbi:MAG: hypothetical protein HYY44_00950 [Deltaproteobacteria bacterium]|nr:hypothetical protein [Deltaproteobacteria bacterium]MBI4374759.1 hypothetical protein [Deltaproteobacteria bacterium]
MNVRLRHHHIALIFLISLSFPAHAFLVLRLNLEHLVSFSEKVFLGRCLEVKETEDLNGRPVQFVTYEVIETLKGPPEKTVTFKQIRLGEGRQQGEVSTTTALSDLPTYKVGEENVIFLSGESDIGLTAPVGLLQGKFLVTSTASGEKKVTNGLKNKGLVSGLSKSPKVKSLRLTSREKKALEKPAETIPYEDFKSLVRKLSE